MGTNLFQKGGGFRRQKKLPPLPFFRLRPREAAWWWCPDFGGFFFCGAHKKVRKFLEVSQAQAEGRQGLWVMVLRVV